MSNINVFVKIDMNGTGSQAFNLPLSTSISSLKQKVGDREGVEIETLMFRTKPTKDGLTLSDYNCYNNCTFFASLRLIGGAQPSEGSGATTFNEFHVQKIGAKHGATVVTTDCTIGCSSGCSESMVKKCKFSCGCIYCADCWKMTMNSQININGATAICCGSSNCGTKSGGTSKGVPVNRDLAFAIAAFSDSEQAVKDAKLDENALSKPSSAMSICVNQKCRKFLMKKNKNGTMIEKCIHCNTEICWMCKQLKHADILDCTQMCAIISLINLGEYVKVDSCPNNVWSTRACINPECSKVNKHKSACRHMTCSCGYQYCHVCLKKWDGHGSRIGCENRYSIAPKQTPKDILNKYN